MTKSCETCPMGPLYEHYAQKKSRLIYDQELNSRALANTSVRDVLSGRSRGIQNAIAATDNLQDSYENLLPDAVEEAMQTCAGPFERTTELTDIVGRSAKWIEKVCGAEVAAQLSVSGMRVEPVQNP